MGFTVLDGGFFATVQDFGRTGYQQYGITVSGAVDRRSYVLSNILVGNGEHDAGLELTFKGPTLLFDADCVIAVTGGDFDFTLNNAPLPMYKAILVRKGDILSSGYRKTGCRAYIAFSGGIDVPPLMGSRSTYTRATLGGYHGRKLVKGDSLKLLIPGKIPPNLDKRQIPPEDFSREELTLRVILGPQNDLFTKKGIETFFSETYTVTSSFDRMGYRLDGKEIEHVKDANIVSDGISFGAIQVPGEGKPIIMLSDKQTTGGYTKIGTVISSDIPVIAQCIQGNRIRFKEVTIEEAQQAYMEYYNRFHGYIAEFNKKTSEIRYSVSLNNTVYNITVEEKK